MSRPPVRVSAEAVPTDIFKVGDDLASFLIKHLEGHELEGRVIAVTSKIFSLNEKRVVANVGQSKLDLIKQESDVYLCAGGHGSHLTIKHGILIPSAGIDESNSVDGDFILFPEDPYASSAKIWAELKSHFSLKEFGLIMTDSHTMPLRRGVTGIGLAHWGFKATRSLVAHPDLFGRLLKFTHVDVLDALASMAVYVMGEADDRTPIAIVDAPALEFTAHSSRDEIAIEVETDLYAPLLQPR